jgi:hypothetical protein
VCRFSFVFAKHCLINRNIKDDEEEVWTGPSDADKRTTKWVDEKNSGSDAQPEVLPIYGNGSGKGKNKKKNNKEGASHSDARVTLAKRILALEQSKKLSNKDRNELRRLRKEAEKFGINVEEMGSGRRTERGNNNNAPVIRDEDEQEILKLLEQMKDLGAMKI